jgi:pyridoxine 5-phosphate synthase
VHPRPDQRHIRPGDVTELAQLLKKYPEAEFNIEGNPFHAYMHFARDYTPAQCTLVPDETTAATSDHGWDLSRDADRLRPVVQSLHEFGCRVSLFMDAVVSSMELAARVGADRIELYTAGYADAFSRGEGEKAVEAYAATARRAAELGLGVNAGHDLSLENLGLFLDQVPSVAEVSIGHALLADALELGLPETVRRYRQIAHRSR